MVRLALLALTLASAAGCDALLTFEKDGRCGNQIVEPGKGEDCDTYSPPDGPQCGAPDTAGACRFVCDATSGQGCAAEWTCGVDGICRFGSGRFSPKLTVPSVLPDLQNLGVGDVDGDGLSDVVALAGTELVVRTGRADGALPESFRLDVDSRGYAPMHLGDLDGDGLTDLIAPLLGGIFVASGRSDGSFAHVPYPLTRLEGSRFQQAIPMRVEHPLVGEDVLVLAEIDGTRLAGFFLSNRDRQQLVPLARLLGEVPGEGVAEAIGVANVDGDPGDEAALAFQSGDRVFVISSTCATTCQPRVESIVQLPGITAAGTRFSDVDGDGHQDLLVAIADACPAVAFGDGRGGFSSIAGPDTAALDCRFAVASELCSTTDPWPVGSADFDGDGLDDYVTFVSVLVTTATSPPALTIASCLPGLSGWSSPPVIADFNGDGAPDLAAVTDATSLEILINDGHASFTRFGVGASDEIRNLVPGDFDGDGISDVAMTVAGEVAVVFGSAHGKPVGPIAMARVGAISRLAAGHFVGPGGAIALGGGAPFLDAAMDLIAFAQTSTVTLLAGAGGRQMIAPVGLVDARAERVGVPLELEIGRFGPATPGADIAAFASEVSIVDGVSTTELALWILEGLPGRSPTRDLRIPLRRGADPACDQHLLAREPSSRCTRTAALDLDQDGRDELFYQELCGEGSAPVIVRVPTSADGPLDCELLDGLSAGDTVGRVEIGDVDGDGRPDVVVGYFGPCVPGEVCVDGHALGMSVAAYLSSERAGGLIGRAPRLLFAGAPAIYALATIDLDPDPAREIALLTDAGIRVGDLERGLLPDLVVALPPRDPFLPEPRLVASDVTGDRLLDLLVANGRTLTVLEHQDCAAPDLAAGRCAR